MQKQETDIRELFSLIWSEKIKIITFSFVLFSFSFLYSLTLKDEYTSEAVFMVSDQSSGSSQIPSNYSSIASMAGINIPQSDSETKVNLGLEIMLSREFLYNFIATRNLMVPIMAAKEWDASSNTLIIDKEIYNSKNKNWESYKGKENSPSMHEAYKEFLSYLSFEKNKLTGFITISITSPSPVNSRDWVNFIIQDINKVSKSKDLDKTNKALEYLNLQVSKTSLKELREVFYSIIESELRTKMLASISEEYLFSIIDQPIIAEKRGSPNRLFISIIGGILGFIIGLTFVLMGAFLKEEPIK